MRGNVSNVSDQPHLVNLYTEIYFFTAFIGVKKSE